VLAGQLHAEGTAACSPPSLATRSLLVQIISLICTNRPGVTQLNYFTADDANQPSGSGAAGAAAEGQQAAAAEGSEDGGEERRPNKRQRKGKAKVGEQAAGTSAAAAAAGGSKGGKLQQEAAERAAAEEPPPSLPAAGGPRGTLIVCPLSVVSNWQMQIEEHTAGNLSGEDCLKLCEETAGVQGGMCK